MGRSLIIRGADFSANCISNEDNQLKKDNYSVFRNCFIDNFNTPMVFVPNNINKYDFYSINKGEVLRVMGDINHKVTAVLVNSIPLLTSPKEVVDFMTGQQFNRILSNEGGRIELLAPSSGYVAIYEINDGEDEFPTNAYIEDYVPNRVLTKENAVKDSQNYLSISSNGVFKPDVNSEQAGKKCGLYYNVFKGEKITFKASNQNGAFGFLPFIVQERLTTKIWFDSTYFGYNLSAGETNVVTVPCDCYLWVHHYDAAKDIFPESITINSENVI